MPLFCILFAKVNAAFSKSCKLFLLSISRNVFILCCVKTLDIKIPFLDIAVGTGVDYIMRAS